MTFLIWIILCHRFFNCRRSIARIFSTCNRIFSLTISILSLIITLYHERRFYCHLTVSTWSILVYHQNIPSIISKPTKEIFSMQNLLTGYHNATGKIDYTLTNNYMFHVILQANELFLRGLISALLYLPLEKINTVQIKKTLKLANQLT